MFHLKYDTDFYCQIEKKLFNFSILNLWGIIKPFIIRRLDKK